MIHLPWQYYFQVWKLSHFQFQLYMLSQTQSFLERTLSRTKLLHQTRSRKKLTMSHYFPSSRVRSHVLERYPRYHSHRCRHSGLVLPGQLVPSVYPHQLKKVYWRFSWHTSSLESPQCSV